MRELFIYYRIAPPHAEQARLAVQRWQAALRARHPGLQARLLKRPAQPDAIETWMETYAADGFASRDLIAELQDELSRGPQELAAEGIERHVEVFMPCAS